MHRVTSEPFKKYLSKNNIKIFGVDYLERRGLWQGQEFLLDSSLQNCANDETNQSFIQDTNKGMNNCRTIIFTALKSLDLLSLQVISNGKLNQKILSCSLKENGKRKES